ncbi:type 1 fimbrial major subunit FimA [Pseudomonas sp. TH34]|uniref:type 1 fimbrial major subunit FimA n=1 Tax=Pseudomonas sp. TH34 TaxID=2796399 RepID=UPI001913A268|nr:type 1 fimbrial major subunit FimA [Pseudomonas sp. TH34]MBK5408851.1 type 1 fimbrial major subunit FimA [Pseudomonas sp. TH34]
MRKINLINSMIAASLLSVGVAHADATIVNGGTIHFQGEVVNAACAVDTGSADQTVQLGQVRTTALSASGQYSTPVGFNIQLNDCDSGVSSQASVAFTGVTDPTNALALALESSAAGAATNVGVQVLDSAGKPMTFDGATFGKQLALSDGTNTLPFQARYIATGPATAGTANANANFKVQYQ